MEEKDLDKREARDKKKKDYEVRSTKDSKKSIIYESKFKNFLLVRRCESPKKEANTKES